jgi:hypothetical protein
MNVREIGWKGVDLIHLAQYRDQWWVIMNTVTNFVFHTRPRISLLAE